MKYPEEYSVDNAMRDMLFGDRDVSDVKFTATGGVIKEKPMADGGYKVEINEPCDNKKGYASADFIYDKNGKFQELRVHNNND